MATTDRNPHVRRTTLLAAVVIAAGLPSGASGQVGTVPSAQPLRAARQLVLVVTDGWPAVDGTLTRYERASERAAWTPIGDRVPVVVGRNGLARGSDLAASTDADAGPAKREGDGRSPAGAFTLSMSFGQAPAPPAGWRLPYRALRDDVECVDDSRSAHYNDLVTKTSAAPVDWTSSEKMWAEPLYKWGIVVDYNAGPATPGLGSCIFLHLWRGPGRGTAGCTAMEPDALTGLLAWLDPARHPVLVQLPMSEYLRLAAGWGLPKM